MELHATELLMDRRPMDRRLLSGLATVAVGVLALAWIGIALTRETDRVASIWFANGFLVAILLQVSSRRWPALLLAGLVGNVGANLLTGDPADLALTLSLCNSLEVMLSVWLVRRLVQEPIDLADGRHLAVFLGLGVAVPVLIVSVTASAVLMVMLGEDFLASFRVWLPGDLLGLLVVVPLGLMRGASTRWYAQLLDWRLLLPRLALLIVVSFAVFYQTRYPLLFVVQIPLLILVYSHGKLGAAIGIFFVAVISVAMTTAGYGPMALVPTESGYERILFVQCFLLFGVGVTYFTGVLLEERTKLVATLRQSQMQFRAIADNVPAMVGHVDANEVYRFANSHYQTMLGLKPESLVGRSMREVCGETVYAVLRPHIQAALAGNAVQFERHAAESERGLHLMLSFIPDLDDDGLGRGFYIFVLDITARKQYELQLMASEARLRAIADNMPALITQISREGSVTFCNATYDSWLGLDRHAVISRPFDQALPAAWVEPQKAAVMQALDGRRVEVTFEYPHGNGLRSFRSTLVPQPDITGRTQSVYVLTSDVTQLKQVQKQLMLLAQFDSLTGLANRREFEERLDQALARARRTRLHVALLFIDIDRFKWINDTLGHGAGDEVLQELALRMRNAVRETDLVGRFAGDEFVILVEGIRSDAEPQFLARKLLVAAGRPFLLDDGSEIEVGISIGIAMNWSHEATPKDLMKAADSALYDAKRSGRGTFSLSRPVS